MGRGPDHSGPIAAAEYPSVWVPHEVKTLSNSNVTSIHLEPGLEARPTAREPSLELTFQPSATGHPHEQVASGASSTGDTSSETLPSITSRDSAESTYTLRQKLASGDSLPRAEPNGEPSAHANGHSGIYLNGNASATAASAGVPKRADGPTKTTHAHASHEGAGFVDGPSELSHAATALPASNGTHAHSSHVETSKDGHLDVPHTFGNQHKVPHSTHTSADQNIDISAAVGHLHPNAFHRELPGDTQGAPKAVLQTLDDQDDQESAQTRPSDLSTTTPSVIAATAALEDALMGTRVSEGHENFITAYNMLTGIRVAVSRCNAKINRELVATDFTDVKVLSFDMRGDTSTPSTRYIFQFKDYSPWVFRHLRELFKLDPADYLMSLTAKYIVSELGSPGKSGSFFYYSRDYRFIIKTVHHSEHKRLRMILGDYYAHVKRYPDTLLSQFYGLHRVKLPFGRKIHFVVMNNVFPAVYEMHERYDLKGSTLGRTQACDPERPFVVYKDLDWLRNHERIVLGAAKRHQLLKQLEIDVAMLKSINVMDYSLLIGIHEMKKGNAALDALVSLREFGPDSEAASKSGPDHNYGNVSKRENLEFAKLQKLLYNTNPTALKEFDFSDDFRKDFKFYHDRGGFQSTNESNEPRDVIYYMGVIDFLTAYTMRKRVETFCKSLVHKRSELSAVPAAEYGERFYRFMCMSVGSAMRSSPDSPKGEPVPEPEQN